MCVCVSNKKKIGQNKKTMNVKFLHNLGFPSFIFPKYGTQGTAGGHMGFVLRKMRGPLQAILGDINHLLNLTFITICCL